MPLDIEITRTQPGTYKVRLSGMLDTETAELLDRRIQEVFADDRARTLRLELHDLTYISSIGLGSLSKIKKTLAARGGILLTIGAQPQIARVFDIVKMLPKETVFATREEADDYLRAIQQTVLEENRHPPQNP